MSQSTKDIETLPLEFSATQVHQGMPVLPHQRVLLMGEDEWEKFTEEWLYSLRPKRYARVEHLGGPGDLGRDVCAYLDTSQTSVWDSFQCKHYKRAPLTPADVWVELGKVIYFTWRGEYSVPRRYYFCAPHDVGTSLAKLLRNAKELQEGLRGKWVSHCAREITSTGEVPLEGDLLTYFEAFDFTIFTYKPVAELIEEHRKTPHHVLRFGGGLPQRRQPKKPPVEVQECELVCPS